MKNRSQKLNIDTFHQNNIAIEFCNLFFNSNRPRFVFGCNDWAKSIADNVVISAFIDDFTSDTEFHNKPIIRTQDLPDDAMVVSAVVLGRPITALTRILEQNVAGLDYFSFFKYSKLPLKPVTILEHFESEFNINYENYGQIYNRLEDIESKHTLRKLLNFRLSLDLQYMEGFVDAQYRQYFEPFLNLQSKGEVFVDVGSFDGYTSKEFIKKCPFYDAIHIVEPDPTNMEQAKSKLIQYEKIKYHKFGASDTTKTLYFKSSGSSSSICDDGDLCINVTRLDELIDTPVSFIKMDIEGAEIPALKGASKLITKYKPRLAISTYHRVDDLWKIPKLVFSYYNGYKLYIRHYTEGVTETVLFFIPHK